MKLKNILPLALMAAAVIPASARENLYLIKGNRIVGQFPTESVDYITFNKPDDVIDDPLWLTVDNVGKNTVTFTINTAQITTAYAYSLISYYTANYYAMNYYDTGFDNLQEGTQREILKSLMYAGAYVAQSTQTVTMTDNEVDPSMPNATFDVKPGTRYYLTAMEIDPATQEPREFMAVQELETLAPGESDMQLSATFVKQGDETLEFNITADAKCQYVITCYGETAKMESYIEEYGYEFLMYTFGQQFTLEDLHEQGQEWPAYDSGSYTLYVMGFDAEGNVKNVSVKADYEEVIDEQDPPKVKITSKEKRDHFVDITFEVIPNDVEKATLRMLPENTVSDFLNENKTIQEIAQQDAIDITAEINAAGSYNFKSDNVDFDWQSILLYAKGKNGKETVTRANFFPDSQTQWSIDYDAIASSNEPSPFSMPRRLKVLNKVKITLDKK